ncbi:TPR_11 domain-containing protein [Cephalotus follicularis]|uniref:TPR_11 domain-containing protein n=1 Tax=Cephalotus follicularis TaxID=3775 RepID=A0A1Q3B7Z3_CEPFO|nr:TPR_11 domain-containing protein [Cephalotus follicularis]
MYNKETRKTMNSNYGKPNSKSSFDFDLGLGSSRPRSLNEQKDTNSSSFSYNSTSSYSSTNSTWQPNKPSWTHQPAVPSIARTSMMGDISGKSWTSSSTSGSGSVASIGIVDKNPHLFGDLVSSALGQGSKGGGSNVPLKSATPVLSMQSDNSSYNKSTYSMGNLADTLPKTNNASKTGGSSGSESFGNFTGRFSSASSNVNVNVGVRNFKSTNLGGPLMKSMSGGGIGMNSNKDPFGSLFDLGAKQSKGSFDSVSKDGNKANAGSDDAFGDFQNASKASTKTFPSSDLTNNNSMGSHAGPNSKLDDFAMPAKDFGVQNQPPVQCAASDPLDMLFPSTSGLAGGGVSGGAGGQQFSELDDWGLESDFGGENDGGPTTTELEGLPPPPAGVTSTSAKNKGIDNQKNGQYADAIKWLSWAVLLLEKAGDKASTTEVLTCRASCFKEVGEYKKAVADCSKVLEHDDANVSVLVQRALLYESMEKYKLGAEDLRTVLKIDPGNRLARSTVHRLTKMAG